MSRNQRTRSTPERGARQAPQGVTFLDHTADVGIDVVAPTLPELFVRAALGMMWLIHDEGVGSEEGGARVHRHVALESADLPGLLRAWLRALLHHSDAESLAFAGARFSTLGERSLEADVAVEADLLRPVREIKGVTLHQLAVERREGAWHGRVIFDV